MSGWEADAIALGADHNPNLNPYYVIVGQASRRRASQDRSLLACLPRQSQQIAPSARVLRVAKPTACSFVSGFPGEATVHSNYLLCFTA